VSSKSKHGAAHMPWMAPSQRPKCTPLRVNHAGSYSDNNSIRARRFAWHSHSNKDGTQWSEFSARVTPKVLNNFVNSAANGCVDLPFHAYTYPCVRDHVHARTYTMIAWVYDMANTGMQAKTVTDRRAVVVIGEPRVPGEDRSPPSAKLLR
jgi:hypothetical protein